MTSFSVRLLGVLLTLSPAALAAGDCDDCCCGDKADCCRAPARPSGDVALAAHRAQAVDELARLVRVYVRDETLRTQMLAELSGQPEAVSRHPALQPAAFSPDDAARYDAVLAVLDC